MLGQDRDADPLLYLRTLCLALTKTKVCLFFLNYKYININILIGSNTFSQNVLVLSLKKYSSVGVDFGTLVNSVFCNYQDEYVYNILYLYYYYGLFNNCCRYIEIELGYIIELFQQTLLQIRTAPV